MKKYLLDTNICIYYIKGMYSLKEKIAGVGVRNCYISEITVAELKYGAEKSEHKEKNRKTVEKFVNSIQIIPIISCLDIYAREKARLRSVGKIVDDFDLLIGTSSIANDMMLVTANEVHFERMDNIKIENWTK